VFILLMVMSILVVLALDESRIAAQTAQGAENR
jgi:hypothetical protein